MIPSNGGIGVLADIERTYTQQQAQSIKRTPGIVNNRRNEESTNAPITNDYYNNQYGEADAANRKGQPP